LTRKATTVTDPTSDLSRLRNLMQVEIETAITHRREKAVLFLDLTRRGIKLAEIWQLLNTDDRLLKLEKAMEEARADRLIGWLAANRVSFPNQDDRGEVEE